jgi:hypothetical protein
MLCIGPMCVYAHYLHNLCRRYTSMGPWAYCRRLCLGPHAYAAAAAYVIIWAHYFFKPHCQCTGIGSLLAYWHAVNGFT